MAKVHSLRRLSTLALRQRRQRLLAQLRLPPHLIRASVVERFTTCGKSNCACTLGQKHGPFYYLTQCLAVGKINKCLLKPPTQQQAARSAIEHYRQLQEHLEELSQINAELLRREENLGDD